MTEQLITVKKLVKNYQTGEVEVRALDGVSFSIEKGFITVIDGPQRQGGGHALPCPRHPDEGAVPRPAIEFGEGDVLFPRRSHID